MKMTEAEAIERAMSILTAELGYTEKASNAQLDHPTANAGNKNYTKYARDLDAVGYYNGRKQGTSWCCVLQDWARYIAFGMALAQRIMGQPEKGCGAGVLWVYKYFKAMRRFYQGITPKRGDQAIFVIYDSRGYVQSWQHTGVVDHVSGGRVYIIEGNTSPGNQVVANGGMVCLKSYPLGDKRIYGYGRPWWDQVVKAMEAENMAGQKKCVATIKLTDIEKISIVIGNGRSLAAVKRAVGCDYIINGGVWDKKLGPVCHLKVDGAVKANEEWTAKGYGWTSGADICPVVLPREMGAVRNAISCVWLLGLGMSTGEKPVYQKDMGGTRGRTAIALANGNLILYCTKDGSAYAAKPEELQQELAKLGASSALMLDGGGSSQCDFGNGQAVFSSREVNNYICVWVKKKEETIMGKYTVTTKKDPLTIRKTPNGTAVGSYAKGTEVNVYEVKDGWGRTDKGWCSMTYLTPVKVAEPPAPVTPPVAVEAADDWGKEAWEKATANGVLDGTRPRDAITRQELAVVLDRLGLLGKGV